MARSDVKKQDQSGSAQSRSSSKPKTATTDQLRMAEMMDGPKVDADRMASMVRNVMDVTNASEDKIAAALHDCGYDEEKAVHSLLEAGSDDDEWTNVGKGRNKKPVQAFAGAGAGFGPAASMGAGFSAAEAGAAGRVRNARGGKSADAVGSSFSGQGGFVSRDERGYRGARGNVRGGVGVRGARQPLPSARVKRAPPVDEGFEMKSDDSSWPAAGSEIEHPPVAGAWGAPPAADFATTAAAAAPAAAAAAAAATATAVSSWDSGDSKRSVPSGVAPRALEEEPDRWSTDVNATPRFDRTASGRSGAGIGSWADATVTPSSTTASGSGWGDASRAPVQWGDDLGASPVKSAWPETESGEPTSEWPTAVAAGDGGAEVSAPASGGVAEASAAVGGGAVAWQQPAVELSPQAQIESWRDNVDGHADDWDASGDVVLQKPVTTFTTLGSDDQPTSVAAGDEMAAVLPITPLQAYHTSFPLGVAEVIQTAVFIKRSQVPVQPVEMPPFCPVSDPHNYQFGFLESASTSTSMMQAERHEYAPSRHQTLASPTVDAIVSSLDGVALASTSPSLVTMDAAMAAGHRTQISGLSHIRPPPGHAPLGAGIEQHAMVAEGLVADSQGANALLALSSDLLPPQSGAIPIPGAGPSSSAHSTPVGSLAASGPPAYLDRTSNVGSDSGVSHQSPLIVGTSPVGQMRTAPSPSLAVHGSPQVTTSDPRVSPSLNARSSPRSSPFHSASPPAPIAMPPMQQQQATQLHQQSDQKAQASKLAQSQPSSASTGSQSHTDQDHQQQQHQHQQHRHQSNGSSHQHHQHHQHQHQQQHHSGHSGHGQGHHQHQHQHQQTSGQSSSAGGHHHGPTGAPPGMGNMPVRMGMKMPHNMMMGHTGPNAYMPNFMGMPVMPGYAGEYDPAQQRNMALSGVREGSANFQGTADGKYGHEGSSSSSSILGTPGAMNFMAQPQPQQMGVYYPGMYMPVLPFPAMYGGYPHHVPKGGFAGGAPGFIPPPGAGYGQSYEDVDYKTTSYQSSTQGSKGSNSSASYNSSAGGNMGAAYNKSHYDKSSYPGSSSGLFPTPGNPPTQAQAAAYQQLAGVAAAAASQHASAMMAPGLAGAGAMPNPALHSQLHALEVASAAAAAAAASAQSQQPSGRAGMPASAQVPAAGGPKHHSHGGAGSAGNGGGSGMAKGHSFNHGNWQ